MPTRKPNPYSTSIRLTDDDRRVLARLMKLTGQDSYAAVIRLAVRESVASHAHPPPPAQSEAAHAADAADDAEDDAGIRVPVVITGPVGCDGSYRRPGRIDGQKCSGCRACA